MLNTTYTDAYVTNRRRAVWSHEMGHGLGLGHASATTSIMYTSASTVYSTYGYYNPRPDDVAGVNTLW